jgi:hypothetical protein
MAEIISESRGFHLALGLPGLGDIECESTMFLRLSIVLALATLNLSGQWLNYRPSVTPLKDGKPNLAAPAPRAANGKPDFAGVGMHETTSLEEMKRLFGNLADDESGPIGMEIYSVHKYGMSALLDV